jgi:diguanylate cyclase (GGDEF)-like protein
MEQLVKQVLDTLSRVSNSKQITLFQLIDGHNGIILGSFVKGEFILTEQFFQFKDTPLEKIISTKQSGICPGTLIDYLPFATDSEIRNGHEFLCLPLLENGQLVGIAILTQKKGTASVTERLQILNLLRPLMATIIKANREYKQLLQLATEDHLTGLYTQRYFETRLQEESSRVRRHGGVYSVLLIAIDNLKKLIESCGYQESQRLLQEVAKIILSSVRKEVDLPCHYNDAQFILLLPNTDVDGAYVLAERIRRRCEQRVFTTTQGIPLKVTVSSGIAHNMDIAHDDTEDEVAVTTRVKTITKEEVVARADSMLNAAKQAGYNRIMVWW